MAHLAGLLSSSAVVRAKLVNPPSVRTVRDIDIAECLCIDYEPLGGTPGLSVETVDDVFWAPVAYRTRKRLKPPAEQ